MHSRRVFFCGEIMEDLRGKKVYIRTKRGEYVYRNVIDIVGEDNKRKLILSKYSGSDRELKIREKDIEWIKVV